MVEIIEFYQHRRNTSPETFPGRVIREFQPPAQNFPDIKAFVAREAFALPVAG